MCLAACSTTSNTYQPPPTREAPKVDNTQAADINTQLGVGYLRQGNLELARNKLNRALSFNPKHADAHTTLAVLYQQIGENDLALEHHQKAVKYGPKEPMALNNYGRFLCQEGDWNEAEAWFLKALNDPLYSTPELPYTNAGTCLVQHDEVTRGEEYLRKALERNPSYAPALVELANASYISGNYLSARAYLQRYRTVSMHSARSLWLGIRIEIILGDKNALASYKLQLSSLYPHSDEAKQLKELEGASATGY